MTIVTSHLEHLGVRFEVLPHERAETAIEEARALGLPPEDVVKAVALIIGSGPALAVVLASQRVDLHRVRAALADPTARLATEEDVQGMFPEFEPGALPAVPSLMHVPVVIDREVLTRRRVAFAAGVQRESVRLASEQLLRGGSVTIAGIAASDGRQDGATVGVDTSSRASTDQPQ
jgi:Ala-tRNA(Pro) deacylase